MKKEICYLYQKKNSDMEKLEQEKESLKDRGYLVITIKEGTADIEFGIQEILKNHIS